MCVYIYIYIYIYSLHVRSFCSINHYYFSWMKKPAIITFYQLLLFLVDEESCDNYAYYSICIDTIIFIIISSIMIICIVDKEACDVVITTSIM